MKIYFIQKGALTLFCVWMNWCFSQEMNVPLLAPIQQSIYMSPLGNDINSGDSLHPVASFTQALNRLNQTTNNQTGEVYTEVVLFEGTYFQALSQPYAMYQIGNKKLNVSVRGKGSVKLDGMPISNISSGGGMIHLLGSRISVRNIEVLYSPANGVRFGFDYNGIEVNPHDILIEYVTVSSTLGHGILVGKGALNTVNPLSITPMAERFLIDQCEVKNAVNFNIPQSQWGSAIKAWNAKHVNIRNCRVHDNAGEGIDFDYCDSVAVYGNTLKDNYANIYFDKVKNGWMYNNFIQNELKQTPGILCAIEAFTGLILNYSIENVKIFNNVLLNTQGIHFWQGNYGANQTGYFHNIDVSHNTVIGHQTGSGSCLHFNYQTFLGQPVPNVSFQNIHVSRNIISAPMDSLNNGQLCMASLVPQVGLSAAYNVYNTDQVPWLNSSNDQIQVQLPIFANAISEVIPSNSNVFMISSVPSTSLSFDYFFDTRFPLNTNAGAIEFDEGISGLDVAETIEELVFPNPTNGELTIPEYLADSSILVTDFSGRTIQHIGVESNGKVFLNDLPNGYYFLEAGNKRYKICLVK
jgi:parallel beta-helix repeat protein